MESPNERLIEATIDIATTPDSPPPRRRFPPRLTWPRRLTTSFASSSAAGATALHALGAEAAEVARTECVARLAVSLLAAKAVLFVLALALGIWGTVDAAPV